MKDVYEQLYRENSEYIYAFALRLTNYDEHSAEDLMQETFCSAFTSFIRFRGDCDIKTWLCSITKNIFLKQLRKKKSHFISISDTDVELLSDGRAFDPEILAEKRELYDRIISEIERLKKKQRDIVILRLFSDLSFAQISDAVNISENSAKVIYHRARLQLQNKLKGVSDE